MYQAIIELLFYESMQKTFIYAQTCSCLGKLYLKANSTQEAQLYHNRALKILKQKQGYKKNDLYALCLKDMANLHLFMHRSDKAQEYLVQYLQIRKNWLWDQTYALALNIMGKILQEKGQYRKAGECFRKSLRNISFLYGDLRKQYEVILYNIASNLQKQGYLQKSLQIYQQVISRTTLLYEVSGINICKVLLKIGQIYQQKNQLVTAEVIYHEAQITFEQKYKNEHMIQAEILNKQGTLSLKNGLVKQAIYKIKKSLSIGFKFLLKNVNYNKQKYLQNSMQQINQDINTSNIQYLNILIMNILFICFKTNQNKTMYYLQVQRIINAFPNHMNINFIPAYFIIGFWYATQKKYHRAYQYFIISLRIAEKFYGKKYQNYDIILDKIRAMKTYFALMEKGGINLQEQLLRIPCVDQIVYYNKGQFLQLIKLYMRSIIFNRQFQNIRTLKQLYEKIGEKHLFNKLISKFIKINKNQKLSISANQQPKSQSEKINQLSFKSNNQSIFLKKFRTYYKAPLNIQSLHQLKFAHKKKPKKFTNYLDLMVPY